MKIVTIKIEGREYEIELDDSFASYVENELDKRVSKRNNTIKDIISAYLAKCYECFEKEKKLQELLERLD